MQIEDLFAKDVDRTRFTRTLRRVQECLGQPFILSGSTAIEWNIALSRQYQTCPLFLHDVDLVTTDDPMSLSYNTGDFDILHFHPRREKGNILLQLIYPATAVRVDIFTPRSPSLISRLVAATSVLGEIMVVSAEDLFARVLAIAGTIIEGKQTDPKHIRSLRRLASVVDEELAAELWADYKRPGLPDELKVARDAVLLHASSHPELLVREVFIDDRGCEHCFLPAS